MALPLGNTYATPGDATASQGLYPSNVGTVGSHIASEQIVSTLYNYNPFAIIRTVFQRHQNKISDFRFLLKAFGMTRAVDAPTTGHYEEDWLVNTLKLGTTHTATSGAGTSVIIGLHADSMYDASQTASSSAVKSSAVEVGHILQFADGVKGRVISKNTGTDPHRITIRPLKTTDEIASPTSGDEVAIVTNAFAEGTGIPNGWMPRISQYTNTFQIVKEGGGTTGSNLSNQLFVEFTDAGDGSLWGKININMMARFERWVNGALLFGSQIDNIQTFVSDLGIDADVKGTEGFDDFTATYGHTLQYTVGAFSLADFDACGKVMQQERIGTRNLMTLDGYDIFTETENLLSDALRYDITPFLMKNAATQAGVPEADWQPFENQDFEFYVGFKGLHKNGFSYGFKQVNEFNDVTGLGNSAYNYSQRRIVAPILGTSRDTKTGKNGFMWGYEYKALNGYSREEAFGQLAGIGVAGVGPYRFLPAVSVNDYMQAGILAEIGFHGACPNQVFRIIPAT